MAVTTGLKPDTKEFAEGNRMVDAVVLKKAVVVAGHPRSGTSLVCQLVESAGVKFPSDFEGDEYNRGGYFELDVAKEVSKQVLDEAMTPEVTRKMNQVVRKLNRMEDWGGLKLVRIPAIFFYRHLAKHLKAVFVFRHPADVKASMFKRGIREFSVPWLKNNNALIAGYENIEDSVILSYESILNRASHVQSALETIGLSIDEEIIDPDQQTQSDSELYVTEDERKLYQRLRRLEKNSGSP